MFDLSRRCGFFFCLTLLVSPALALACQPPGVHSQATTHLARARAVGQALMQTGSAFDRILGASVMLELNQPSAQQYLLDLAESNDMLFARAAIDTLLFSSRESAIEGLLELAASKPQVHQQLLTSLSYVPRNEARPLLYKAAASGPVRERIAAYKALARLSATRASVQILRQQLNIATQPPVALHAAFALAVQGQPAPAAETLSVAATSKDERARRIAAVGLSYLPDESASVALQRLTDDADRITRIAAWTSLAARQDATAIGHLGKLIEDNGGMEGLLAAAGLRRLPANLAFAIARRGIGRGLADTGVALRILEAFGWIDASAHEADVMAIARWGLQQVDIDVRTQALWLIGKQHLTALAGEAASYLADPEPAVRGMGAWAVTRTLLPACPGEQIAIGTPLPG